MGGIIRGGPGICPTGFPACFMPAGGIPVRRAPGAFSDDAGDTPKPSVVGEAACEDGVGRDFGEPAGRLPACIGGSVL